ncbi:hypothetical protein CDD82_1303 [Ophiocordyceps australis]|uniref:Uncharacterized protein n=1 Tax=Ophiocordyceps australis TaxID=1399860 RepID=A0A2C5YKP1_9HYPO|nr:hypothetical protein CDD82_1303 [Ophiocordyceps australis]
MPKVTTTTPSTPASKQPLPRPPMSPITPTLIPAQLPDATPQQPLPSPALPRPVFRHSQPDQVAMSPPPPQPIDFDANPDVLALKSAISVLQVQRKRAEADMQTLSTARDEALVDTEAFVQDLAAGRVRSIGEATALRHDAHHQDHDEKDQAQDAQSTNQDTSNKAHERQWNDLPRPQNIVRCPPINWAKYAVVGESLDKLHAEQVSHPTQGTPASLGPGGAYEFKSGSGSQEKYPGIAAPYAPGKDRIIKKAKGSAKK